MSEPSLAWTAVNRADMFKFMTDKIWYKFDNKDSEFDAWATWANASGSAAQKAAAAKFSGKVINWNLSQKFIQGWPEATDAIPGYVRKWGGGCLADASSGVGGFCFFEHNDTRFYDCALYEPSEAVPAAE